MAVGAGRLRRADGLSWLAEVTMLAAPTPTVRAICALPLGAVTGWICVRAAIGALR